MENRPRGREKNVTGQGKDVYKRGDGLGTGPVGNSQGYQGRPGTTSANSGTSSGKRAVTRSGGIKPIFLIILAVLIFGGGGAGLGGLLGGGSSSSSSTVYTQQQSQQYQQQYQQPQQYQQQQQASSVLSGFDISSLLGNFSGGSVSSGWQRSSNVGKLNTSVSSLARAKRTKILGNGKDTITIMVYMCGTDLESKSGMGTSDLQEMAAATIGSNVNLLVYTGGCKSWQNNVVSSSVNQIYKIENGGLRQLVSDAGSVAMTKADTLASYIKWCSKNYPANRNALIFWDHGGGSLSGYGYDEKFSSSGSMSLKGINDALNTAGVTFDFIGFDACLMATTETALTLAPYADYMIASEETEPGVGWYYTNWLTKLSANTSMPTLEIGKNIVDDFVDVCAQKCAGQQTTLSVIDLAELEKTVPSELGEFAASASKLLQNKQYQVVSDARSGAREFAASSRIDQVDLVHLADNMGTTEGNALADALLNAVKYNRTSSNMTNAYGLSIYFPYKKTSTVDSAVKTYEAIGMDSDYVRCIQQFASIETGGQAVSGGAASPLSSLLGAYAGSSGSYGGSSSSAASSDMISQVLSGLLSGNLGNVSGLTGSNSSFLGKSLDVDSAAEFISENQFDAGALVWADGQMRLSEQQWSLVRGLELNVFFDDGNGYIDFGLDNVFDFTEDGALIGDYDGTWLAINEQPVAYYHIDTFDDGDNYCITGRVPAMLNDSRVDLILVFDNDHPYGYIAGARSDYRDGETDTIAKAVTTLEIGDRIDFLCDYYGYDGSYQDSYYLGDPLTVDGELSISNVYIDADAANATYRITDIYQQQYWTPVIP